MAHSHLSHTSKTVSVLILCDKAACGIGDWQLVAYKRTQEMILDHNHRLLSELAFVTDTLHYNQL